MSYTLELKEEIKEIPNSKAQAYSQPELGENPSLRELFSYGVCCVAQGAIWISYLAIAVFVPVAISRGIF